MTEGALIDTLLVPNPLIPGQPGGGTIAITATESIVVTGQRLGTTNLLPSVPGLPTFTNLPSGIYSENVSANTGSRIVIQTPSLTLQTGRIDSQAYGAGAAGDLSFLLGQLTLKDGAFSGSSAYGAGASGSVHIRASDSITMSGFFPGIFQPTPVVQRNTNSSISSTSYGLGQAGPVFVSTATLTMNGADIASSTLGSGGSGSVNVQAAAITLTGGAIISSSTLASGPGGIVSVTASEQLSISGHSGRSYSIGSVTIENNASVIAANTFGTGPAGALTVNTPILTMFDGGDISTSTGGDGPAGSITVNAGSMTVSSGASISSNSGLNVGEAFLFGNGAGGTVTVNATGPVTIADQGSGLFTTTVGTGAGGNTNITAQSLTIQNGGTLSANTTGAGNAGNILVKADSVSITGGGRLTSSSVIGDSGELPSGSAGNITIQGLASPAESVLISSFDDNFNSSGIFTDTQGEGAGGNIFVNANSVTLQNGGTLSATTSGTETTATGGTITVNAYQVNTDGATISVETTEAGQAGSIALITQPMAELTADAISLHNSLITSSTSSNANAGEILMQTGTLSIENSQISSDAIPLEGFTGGNAGTIYAQVGGDITLTNSVVSTSTVGNGNAGDILMASNSLQAESTLLASIAAAPPGLSGGNGGTIQLNITQDAYLSNSTIDSQTVANGSAGNVFVDATNLTLNSSSLSTGTSPGEGFTGGNAGDIQVTVGQLTMNDGLIVSQSFFSAGNGGTVAVNASESITTSGSGILPFAISTSTDGAAPFCPGTCGNGGSITLMAPTVVLNGAGLNSTTTGQGNAGNILTKVGTLTVLNGAQISASAENPGVVTGAGGNVTITGLASPAQSVLIDGPGSGIFTSTKGTGTGGNIFVNANSVTLRNRGTLSASTSGTASSATGGTITVDAANTVTMNSASITASSTGVADAGSINLTAMNGFTMQNSTITTLAGQGAGGGNIKVTTAPSATVLLQDSMISASVADGLGGGGNISIDPQFVILQNSQILAQAAQGQGGAITIIANLFLPDANSLVNADSGSGVNGTITIQSPNAPVSGQIQPLGKTPLIATSLLNQHCAALLDGQFSSFTVAGRDSLPTEPGSWLASPLYAAGTGTGEGLSSLSGVVRGGLAAHQIDQTNPVLLSLRQIAPAGFLTQAFAVDRSASCTS
jgi:large exoprotein involved in heme utilization and adhesion